MAELTAAEVLAAHREMWDMPTLFRSRPEVIAWLNDKIEVHFGLASDVIIVDRRSGAVRGTETVDVRVALDEWLVDQVRIAEQVKIDNAEHGEGIRHDLLEW